MEKYSLNLNEIGKRIRKLRTAKNITQRQLADFLSVGDNHISKLETGNSSISLNVLINLCKYFDTTIDYLIFGTLQENQTENDIIISNILSDFDETDKEYIITILKGLRSHNKKKYDT